MLRIVVLCNIFSVENGLSTSGESIFYLADNKEMLYENKVFSFIFILLCIDYLSKQPIAYCHILENHVQYFTRYYTPSKSSYATYICIIFMLIVNHEICITFNDCLHFCFSPLVPSVLQSLDGGHLPSQ